METIADAANVEVESGGNVNTVADYINAHTSGEEFFYIMWPDGNLIKCLYPARFSIMNDLKKGGLRWFEWLNGPDIAIELPIVHKYVQEELEGEVSSMEAVATYFLKYFCREPIFTDLELVQMIKAPVLLEHLYHQINARLSPTLEQGQLIKIGGKGKGSGRTNGTTRSTRRVTKKASHPQTNLP